MLDAESESYLINSAARLYLEEYDPNKLPIPVKVHYAPHVIGKPGKFTAEFSDMTVEPEEELFQGWFNDEPRETEYS